MAPQVTEDMFMIEGKRSRELALESYLNVWYTGHSSWQERNS